jgi:hypothetical protein
MIDIVTVVFRDELPILKLQAESVELYCQEMCLHTINVVINDDFMSISDIDTRWWGKYSDRVRVIHRNHWPVNYSGDGWLTQQLLKLLASSESNSRWSMVVDAKTIFVNTVDLERLFDDNGRLSWGYMPVFSVFNQARQIVSELFNIDQTHVAGPAGVPFVFHKSTVSSMIKEVETRTNKKFADWFQSVGMVTEFILYSGYVQYRDGSLDSMYTTTHETPYYVCNICHNETEIFDNKFLDMFAEENLTVSIHRRAWTNLSETQRNAYKDFLVSKGINRAKELV